MSRLCPLYNTAVASEPWKHAKTAHAGLLFDKFADAWGKGQNGWTFDKGENEGQWLKRFDQQTVGNREALEEASTRQINLIESFGGKLLCFENSGRFVTGLGRTHPVENGFAFHPTLGVPYLPGSGVKGVLAAWLRDETDQWDRNHHKWNDDTDAAHWFGTQSHAGGLVFLDLLPTKPPRLEVDIMTPHYGPYYQDVSGETPPADWHSPNPISLLTVAAEISWQTGILPARGSKFSLNEVADHLKEALEWLGAGAKTAVGYGRFERRTEREAEMEARRAQAEVDRKAEQEREEALARLGPELAKLVRRAEDEGWAETDQRNTLLDGIDRYLKANPVPTVECIEWLRERLVRFWPAKGQHADIWSDPHARMGKRDKPVHKSKRASQLVERLKAIMKQHHDA